MKKFFNFLSKIVDTVLRLWFNKGVKSGNAQERKKEKMEKLKVIDLLERHLNDFVCVEFGTMREVNTGDQWLDYIERFPITSWYHYLTIATTDLRN